MDLEGFEHLKVRSEHDGQVVLVELDHGKANEMGSAQLREFERLTALLTAPNGPRAVITFSRKRSSRGTPIFVSGANVTERRGWSDADVRAHVRWQRAVLASLRRAPVFHLAVVDGVALGWGTEYLLTCDYRIACDGASFALPETGLGILPGAGGTGGLADHVGLAHTLRLGMTGERIDADEALRIGLVQERRGTVDEGLDRARELAALAARRSPTAIAAFKSAVLATTGQPAIAREEIEARAYEHCVASGEAAVGREHFETIVKGGEAPWSPRAPFSP